ncbi:flagellar biosynthetic protein FliQ [Vibrio sp. Vb2880]|uniref:flagellar biosynthetic protein FliQ n=1 Tax=Vibrio TaxID=662 RepID=UPI0001B91AE7|nr:MULTISPECIES: flagellar biosynthetic protein FliQ [Vibrio]ADT87407.1 flagellar biosynthetic protein [Vibrio furnissii NCTC 11218]EEX42005.1 flagellar biosynthesis protein FliQ [Vibrio furnissii CIP 102972]MBO0214093.1 flagellar biosynthetic protein FliQ [Vibrio sp. Vb2880]MCG6211315.1 flagellar biosynthetic protein FliQ [Vibrio furnissii]MCG6229114.1 flagellar biosynthetic protein FliQ [Vibrio furnissii]
MTPEMSVTLVAHALWVIIAMVSVLIVPSLLVGLIVAVFQAVTQINEQTLSFLPRLLVTMVSIIVTGHWLLMKLTTLFETIFHSVPSLSQ